MGRGDAAAGTGGGPAAPKPGRAGVSGEQTPPEQRSLGAAVPSARTPSRAGSRDLPAAGAPAGPGGCRRRCGDSAEVTAGGPRSRDASSSPPAHYSPQHAPRSWVVKGAASASLLHHHRGLSRCLKPRPMVLRALPADWPGRGG